MELLGQNDAFYSFCSILSNCSQEGHSNSYSHQPFMRAAAFLMQNQRLIIKVLAVLLEGTGTISPEHCTSVFYLGNTSAQYGVGKDNNYSSRLRKQKDACSHFQFLPGTCYMTLNLSQVTALPPRLGWWGLTWCYQP